MRTSTRSMLNSNYSTWPNTTHLKCSYFKRSKDVTNFISTLVLFLLSFRIDFRNLLFLDLHIRYDFGPIQVIPQNLVTFYCDVKFPCYDNLSIKFIIPNNIYGIFCKIRQFFFSFEQCNNIFLEWHMQRYFSNFQTHSSFNFIYIISLVKLNWGFFISKYSLFPAINNSQRISNVYSVWSANHKTRHKHVGVSCNVNENKSLVFSVNTQ